jgi:DNA repair exonuclease SbcCD ATPase subunit
VSIQRHPGGIFELVERPMPTPPPDPDPAELTAKLYRAQQDAREAAAREAAWHSAFQRERAARLSLVERVEQLALALELAERDRTQLEARAELMVGALEEQSALARSLEDECAELAAELGERRAARVVPRGTPFDTRALRRNACPECGGTDFFYHPGTDTFVCASCAPAGAYLASALADEVSDG